MGEVFLARDVLLGRPAALKFLHAEQAGSLELSAIIAEARAIARINHPNIVAIYGIGSWNGRAYLALEYVHGESLEARLSRGRLTQDEALRTVRAIAEALAAAHEVGVRHLDLKPANVVIGRDGRPRVVDFGLARLGATEPSGALAGTPRYMAPEQWRGQETSDRTDVWALCVLLVELVTGDHPFDSPTIPALYRNVMERRPALAAFTASTPGLSSIVRRGLALSAPTRPSATELRDAVSAELGRGSTPKLPHRPFPGLRTFDEGDAPLFFGRSDEIDAFVARLDREPALVVTGPSGVGKSSFVSAGVLPRLARRSPCWVVRIRPGARPMVALAHALVGAVGEAEIEALVPAFRGGPAVMREALLSSPLLFSLAVHEISNRRQAAVVVFVDQLEELFTHTSGLHEQDAFLSAIFSLPDAEPTVRVIATLRDDCLGRTARVTNVFVLGALGRAELRRTISMPIERFGYTFEDERMVEEIVDEVCSDATPLPIVQFACQVMWDERDDTSRLIPRVALARMGGAMGALVRHAEHVLAGLSEADVAVVRRVFLTLLTSAGHRRVVAAAVVEALAPSAGDVVGRLVDSRLLVRSRAIEGDGGTIEIVHESLAQRWSRLQSWLVQSRGDVLLSEQLVAAADLWNRRGRPEAETWRGRALDDAKSLSRDSLPPVALEFLASAESLERGRRRRQRWSRSAGLVFALIVTFVAVLSASEFRRREQEAHAQTLALRMAGLDLGAFELVVRCFDWDDQSKHTRPAAIDLRALDVRLMHGDDGEAFLPEQMRLTPRTTSVAGARAWLVEAPGVPMAIEVHGRGGSCAPSVVRYSRPPGYADRRLGHVGVVELEVPSCAASSVGSISVPGSRVVLGGPGSPPIERAAFSLPEEEQDFSAFELDRAEASNAQFALYSRYAALTGDRHPRYPVDTAYFERAADPEYPIAFIDWATARRYCRYWGKDLPTWVQWSAAARGGATLPGTGTNPRARRSYPWGGPWNARHVNHLGSEDGFEGVAPVVSFIEGSGPYGHLNLSGNVSEWLLGVTSLDPAAVLVPVAGGDWAEPPSDKTHGVVFFDSREPRFLSYGTGVRCATHAPRAR